MKILKEIKASAMADDTGSIISEIRELVMKTKVHMDFVHVKLEEIWSK